MTLQFLGVSLTLCFVISKKTTFSTVDSTVTARRFPFVVTWLAAWLSKMIQHPMILVHLLEKTTQAKPKKLFVILVTMFCIDVRFFPWIFRSRLKCLHNPQPNRTLVSTFKHCTIIPWSLRKSQEIREFCGNLRWTLCHDMSWCSPWSHSNKALGSEDFVPPSTLVTWWLPWWPSLGPPGTAGMWLFCCGQAAHFDVHNASAIRHRIPLSAGNGGYISLWSALKCHFASVVNSPGRKKNIQSASS